MSQNTNIEEEKTKSSSSEKIKGNDVDENLSEKRWTNDRLMITTLLSASIITFLIYTVPDWVFIEIPTRDIIYNLLSLIGLENSHNVQLSLIPTLNPSSFIPSDLMGGEFPFLEATANTPGIQIEYLRFNPIKRGDYWIVKACTGMQAGGLLLAIIMVTEAPWKNKILASSTFFVALFIGNTLRIAFHLWCVTVLVTDFGMDPEPAFYWAHDVSSKVIGFFGTIFFALIIEKMGVGAIDTFADWLDWIYYRINSAISVFSK